VASGGAQVNAIGGSDAGVLVLGERSPFAEFYIDRPVQFVDRAASPRRGGGRE